MYQHHGLQALQTYRIIHMLDSIAYQNAQIDINILAKITNIAPKSIRKKLNPFFQLGVKLPLTYLSNKWSFAAPLFRYCRALMDFFLHNVHEEQILQKLFISKNEWNFLLFDFFQYTYKDSFFSNFPQPLIEELTAFKKDIMETSRYHEFAKLFPPMEIPLHQSTSKKDHFYNTLKYHFSFSNALIIDYLKFLDNEAFQSNKNRRPGEIIFYAVRDTTISGTPLNNTELKPITLTIFSEDDKEPESPYKTIQRKWNKAVRYCLQAQNQNTNLTQYDLSYLLGVSVAVVKNLMKKNKQFHIPTRGNAHDIGPGVSHAEQIIKLHLEGYTETEIKFKTRHSYDSIENYLLKFAKVVG
ncbi:MAG: DUF1670 domain-containing protein, partial [Gammaproteobacteria bacterium]|nr:DUF1670 domain-containing protein [Gammaproteobacteria bacterium]